MRSMRVLVPLPMRWWCTAETARSDGIGAQSASCPRSVRITMLCPSAIASEVFQRGAAPGGVEEHRDRHGLQPTAGGAAVERADLLELLVEKDGVLQLELARAVRTRLEEVALGARRGL